MTGVCSRATSGISRTTWPAPSGRSPARYACGCSRGKRWRSAADLRNPFTTSAWPPTRRATSSITRPPKPSSNSSARACARRRACSSGRAAVRRSAVWWRRASTRRRTRNAAATLHNASKSRRHELLSTPLWGGRFSKSLDQRALTYTTSLPVDRRLFEWDVLGSIAHARMLARQGVIPAADAQAIVSGLSDLLARPPRLDGKYEDVHSLVEAELARQIGEPAGRLHTARSRNDQVATDMRLFVRSALIEGVAGILDVQSALVEVAQRDGVAIMPGYTHLQRAQPILLGHHLLAYWEMLERDAGRLRDAYARADVLPLGAGALAGSPYPLDRKYVARALGFSSVSRNSLDAVADRDFLIEHLAALASLAMHLSRLAEELVLWSTVEFGFISLDESLTTGS